MKISKFVIFSKYIQIIIFIYLLAASAGIFEKNTDGCFVLSWFRLNNKLDGYLRYYFHMI